MRVTYHYNQGRTGLPNRYHFLLKTNIHILLYRTVPQCLPWIAATSSARQQYQRISIRIKYLLRIDQLLLSHIHTSFLILALSTFEPFTPLRNVEGSDKTHILFIGQEDDKILYQDLEHYHSLVIIWNFT